MPVDAKERHERDWRELSETVLLLRHTVDLDEERKVKEEGHDKGFQDETVIGFIPAHLRAVPPVPPMGCFMDLQLFVVLVLS